jgi:hypothetical protein
MSGIGVFLADSVRILLADSARREINSKCCLTAASTSCWLKQEFDLLFVLERLAFRDLGDEGRARAWSSLADCCFPSAADTERFVFFEEVLDCGDCVMFCLSSWLLTSFLGLLVISFLL